MSGPSYPSPREGSGVCGCMMAKMVIELSSYAHYSFMFLPIDAKKFKRLDIFYPKEEGVVVQKYGI